MGNSEYEINKMLSEYDINKNPLMLNFLKERNNFELLKECISKPTEEKRRYLNKKFEKYYENVRLTAYFHKLIKNFSIDFDKKSRKLNQRFLLAIDDDYELINKNQDTEKHFEAIKLVGPSRKIKDEIEDLTLIKALDELTKTQYKVLELIYVEDLTNIEVAEILNSSPQNISNLHRKALKKLRISLEDVK